MTHKEILTRACSIAYANGWRDNGSWYRDGELTVWTEEHAFELIFNHDFARAIWGEELSTLEFDNGGDRFHGDFLTPFGEMSISSYEDAFVSITVKNCDYHLIMMAK